MFVEPPNSSQKHIPSFVFTFFIVKNVFTEQVTSVPLSSIPSPHNTAQVLAVEEECHFSLQPADGTSNTTLLNLHMSGAVL